MTLIALNLTLYSHPKNIAEVEPYISQIIDKYEINQDLFGNMLITLTEAVSNAIIHGNSAKSDKRVFVTSDCSSKRIQFSVRDEGNGFNPSSLPDPTAPDNILNPGGRGVFLMRQLSDSVKFEEDGRKVIIEFNLQ
jgi:serine/threonine-protein kinase RsbW